MISFLFLAGCDEHCICPTVYEPVCGEDGETYSNECYAECEGIEIAHGGECEEEEECYCPTVYEPVCGEDGVTYGNECEAECAGVDVAYGGECVSCLDLNCEEYRYDDCPDGCFTRCVPSSCSGEGRNRICTADCGGQGSCYCPETENNEGSD